MSKLRDEIYIYTLEYGINVLPPMYVYMYI